MRTPSRLGWVFAVAVGGCGSSSPSAESSGGAGGTGSSSSGISNVSTSSPRLPSTEGSTSQPGGSTSASTDDDTGSGTKTASTSSGSSSSYGSACDSPCGDGLINCGEDCDCGLEPCTPAGVGFAVCVGMQDILNPDHVFTGGVLGCNPANCRFDFSGCEWGCGDGVIANTETCEPELESPSCADLGLGDATDPVPCDKACQLDTSVCL
ncbi:MAG: hypothetical protein ACRBN8_25050 [Nannocystales bacterium]